MESLSVTGLHPWSLHSYELVPITFRMFVSLGDRKHVAIYLNDKFLKDILSLIDKTYPLRENRCAAMRSISAKVTGEGQAKPLEHLVACIPGIEVRPLNTTE